MDFGTLVPFLRQRSRQNLTVYTHDWSLLDSDDAPSLNRIAKLYQAQLGFPVARSRETSGDAPLLEIAVPVVDIVGVDKALRRLFRGEDIMEDREVWQHLTKRLAPVECAQRAADPAFLLTPTAAAILAVNEATGINIWSSHPVCLEGYKALSVAELHDIGLRDDIDTLGNPPSEKPLDGHLFRFRIPQPPGSTRGAIAVTVLIDAHGIHSRHIYPQTPPMGIRGDTLLALQGAALPMPTVLRPAPLERIPPKSHRITFLVSVAPDREPVEKFISKLDSRAQERSVIEKQLGQQLSPPEGKGYLALHVDMTDISDWPDMRKRLFAGENLAPERARWNDIALRLREALNHPFRMVFLPLTGAAILGLERVQHGGDPVATMVSIVHPRGGAPIIAHNRIDDLRFSAVNAVHPFVLEKMPHHLRFPEQDCPFVPPEDEEIEDGGFALRYNVEGVPHLVLVQP